MMVIRVNRNNHIVNVSSNPFVAKLVNIKTTSGKELLKLLGKEHET